METAVTVGVPVADADDLSDVTPVFADPPVALEAHPFDGAVFAQVAGVVTSAGVPVLLAWIKARTEKRKHMSISAYGVEATGYTVEELQPVLEMLKADSDAD